MKLETAGVRLLALDIDGTLVGPTLTISSAVKSAVARAMQAGVRVTLVTGRMFQAARPFARELGLRGPLTCYQGAAIFQAEDGAKLLETPLAHDVALDITHKALSDGMHVQLYRDDQFYVQERNEWSDAYAHISGVQPVVVDSLAKSFAGHDSTKVVVVSSPERAAEYVEVMQSFCGKRAYVTRSQPEFVEILNLRVDKGEALRWIAKREGIALEETLAVGDSWNDAPLLDAAGFGVAMGSAPPELTARADAVVGDVAGDGVAEAIEKFVLR